MVLEGTFASILTSLISRYANARGSDVGLGIRGGYLSLENVDLKIDVLNDANLPFCITSGRLGKLKAQIPWYALGSKPVEIYGENLYITAKPHSMDKESKSNEECNVVENPKGTQVEKLKSSELVGADEVDEETTKWYTTKLGRLGANVFLELYNICFTYQDNDCEVCIRVASVITFSADANWNMSSHPVMDASYGSPFLFRKVFRVSGLSITSQSRVKLSTERVPLVDGLNFEIRLALSTTSQLKSPSLTDIEVELDEFFLTYSDRQLAFLKRVFSQDVQDPQVTSDIGTNTLIESVVKNAIESSNINDTESANEDDSSCASSDDTADILGVNILDKNTKEDFEKASVAVEKARDAGGRIYSFRIRTEDRRARQENDKLRKQLEEARAEIEQLKLYKQKSEEYEKALDEDKEQIKYLKEKNRMLLNDVDEMEKLFSESSRNKDAVIRELEAALSKAEKNLSQVQSSDTSEEWFAPRDILFGTHFIRFLISSSSINLDCI
ncbi:Putative vacuolar protein sorting-associated protein 13F [Galdieria sulphuraria]|nr:Putative vacuolar protein sorting-associated protein 13F [Galdieria sulphuraria]